MDNCYYEKVGDNETKIDFKEPITTSGCIWMQGYQIFKPMQSVGKIYSETIDYIDIDAIDNKENKIKCAKNILSKNAPSRAKRKVENGSTLFSMVRPYLRNIAYVEEQYEHCVASTGFYVCTPQFFIVPKYLYYLMISPYVVSGINFYMKGDNSPSVRSEQIESFLFPIPSLERQRKIAKFLDTVFNKINLLKSDISQLNSSIAQLKIKILDDIFGENSRYKSYYTQTQEKLENIASLITKGSTPTSYGFQYVDKGISFVKVENVHDYYIDHTTIRQFITVDAHEFQKRSQLQENDMLFSIAGTIGRIYLVKTEDLPANTNQAFAIIRGYDKILIPSYLKWYLTWYLNDKSKLSGHGGGMLNITLNDLKKLEVFFPANKNDQQILVDRIEKLMEVLSSIS